MSGSGPGRPGGPPPARHPTRRAPLLVVAGAAALVALALGGQGLLVPAGPTSTLVRAGGALVALAAVAVLVRLDGPARGTRMLAVVAVAGALTGLATLPVSPVHLDDARPPAGDPPAAGEADQGGGTGWLDRADPPAGTAARLQVPPGAVAAIEDGAVVARQPGGGVTVLGPADDGTLVEQADGSLVVVGGGVLLEVPEPLPADPDAGPDAGPDPLDDRTEALLALLLGAFALLAFAPPVLRVAGRVAPGPVEPVDPPAPGRERAAAVEDGLADVLRAMLADPDPRTAVIAAYARLLVALAAAGVPRRPEEGPHEHLWRILGPLGVRRAPVHRLAELFVRARFTPRPVTPAEREAAIACLADALADLRLDDLDADVAGGGTAPEAAPAGGVR